MLTSKLADWSTGGTARHALVINHSFETTSKSIAWPRLQRMPGRAWDQAVDTQYTAAPQTSRQILAIPGQKLSLLASYPGDGHTPPARH